MSELSIVKRAMLHRNSIAFKNESSEQTYQHLLNRSEQLAAQLLENESDLNSSTVAMLIPADPDFVSVQWAIWRAGGIILPLCLSATQPEWEYSLSDSNTSIVITTQELKHEISDLCNKLNVRLLVIESHHTKKEIVLPAIKSTRPAMILYTSGTTNKPKGVLTTHANIEAQIESLVEAWKWKASDRIPLFLPLHHIHGIINVICCAMWSGALVEPFARFDINAITNRVRQDAYTVFMAVPTIYVKLIQMLESTEKNRRDPIIAGFKNMRLMVSGSAALPATVHDTWFNLTGQKLLERYGMTEIGMSIGTDLKSPQNLSMKKFGFAQETWLLLKRVITGSWVGSQQTSLKAEDINFQPWKLNPHFFTTRTSASVQLLESKMKPGARQLLLQ
jgi:malonyl-CoA/methylmalonyl-CoA synthetase